MAILGVIPSGMKIQLLHFPDGVATVTGPTARWGLAIDGRSKTFYGIDAAQDGCALHRCLLVLSPERMAAAVRVAPMWLHEGDMQSWSRPEVSRLWVIAMPKRESQPPLAAVFFGDRLASGQSDALWGMTRDGRLLAQLQGRYPGGCVRIGAHAPLNAQAT